MSRAPDPTTPASPTPGQPARTAIVVDWLAQFGGAELVIRELLAAYPAADLFALFDAMDPADRARLAAKPAHTSFLQHIPGIRGLYRKMLSVMPVALLTLDLDAYDLVISSHHSVAKGIRKRAGRVHVCYCHSPTRYLWDKRDEYLADHGIGGPLASLARLELDRLQRLDRSAADGVDQFLVNSQYVAERVKRHYGRESIVIPPPVDVDFFTPQGAHEPDLYVAASRQVPYKRIDRIVEVFRALPDRRLVVLGDGPQHARLAALAEGATNISLRGEVPREELRDWFRKARAFVFAADEDFGIVPLEAQACGTPVIALGKGGALETVRGDVGSDRTGLFFENDAPATIADAVRRFEALDPAPSSAACRANAERFTAARFRTDLTRAVDRALASKR